MPASGERQPRKCEWLALGDALKHFAVYDGRTQTQQHIKPLHWYVACRLVLEGGFHPAELEPRPPFDVTTSRRGRHVLHFDPDRATGSEATVLGGLKTKTVDVVADKPGIGPVLAVSCKGMTGAFRNLTNRMEETIGECTNLHIRYPALVFGYLFVIRANRFPGTGESAAARQREYSEGRVNVNDVALAEDDRPVEAIIRFHAALRELAGRDGIRSDPSGYEAIALALVDMRKGRLGAVLESFPPSDRPLRLDRFFNTLYRRYDERNVVSAPDLAARNRRLEWAPDSPALQIDVRPALDYEPRVAG